MFVYNGFCCGLLLELCIVWVIKDIMKWEWVFIMYVVVYCVNEVFVRVG